MQRENCETTQAPEQNRDTRASAVSTVSKSKERKKNPHMRDMHEKKFIHPSAYFLQRRLLSELLWWLVLACFMSIWSLSRQVNARTDNACRGDHISRALGVSGLITEEYTRW